MEEEEPSEQEPSESEHMEVLVEVCDGGCETRASNGEKNGDGG
jgi:hypothetical protein